MNLDILRFKQKKVKSRIVYVPGVGYKPEQEKDTFPDLVKFAEVKLKTFSPSPDQNSRRFLETVKYRWVCMVRLEL